VEEGNGRQECSFLTLNLLLEDENNELPDAINVIMEHLERQFIQTSS
jgi:hypothetical protein